MVVSKNERNLKIKITLLLALVLSVQIFSWFKSKEYIPAIGIVPEVPSLYEAKISALGDEQFYFRFLAIYIQNAGDSFGRFTKLKHYDYEALMNWFKLLDQLDCQSNVIPSAAAYIYSNTQRPEDNIYLINYLESTYDYDPVKKWWWLSQAVVMASEKLKNHNVALRLAFKLSNTPYPQLPRWAQQMPAIIYANMGEKELALNVMQELAQKYDDYSQADLNYINYFIHQQLGFKDKIIMKEPKFHDVEPLYTKRYGNKKK
jgi:hypothetical protein